MASAICQWFCTSPKTMQNAKLDQRLLKHQWDCQLPPGLKNKENDQNDNSSSDTHKDSAFSV